MNKLKLQTLIAEAIHGASRQCILDLDECLEEGSCNREAWAVAEALDGLTEDLRAKRDAARNKRDHWLDLLQRIGTAIDYMPGLGMDGLPDAAQRLFANWKGAEEERADLYQSRTAVAAALGFDEECTDDVLVAEIDRLRQERHEAKIGLPCGHRSGIHDEHCDVINDFEADTADPP